MIEAELRAILELKMSAGLGDVRLRRLLRAYTTAADALDAYRRDRRARAEDPVRREMGPWEREAREDRIERALTFIEASGIQVVLEREPDYPEMLRHPSSPRGPRSGPHWAPARCTSMTSRWRAESRRPSPWCSCSRWNSRVW